MNEFRIGEVACMAINSSSYNGGFLSNRSVYEISKLINATIVRICSHKMFFFESRRKKDQKLC